MTHHVPHVVLPSPTSGDVAGIHFRQARHYRWSRRGFSVLWVVVHSAECAETEGAAEALQAYAATMPDGRVASWHYAVDSDGATQSVLERDTAYHCPPLNDVSIGIELAGRASQTAGQWADDYSTALLRKLAPLLAGVCSRHRIPLRTVDDETLRGAWGTAKELVARQAGADEWLGLRTLSGGTITHAQAARVFGRSTHYDPGPNFPMNELLRLAKGTTT